MKLTSAHATPVTARELFDHLTKQCGAEITRISGTHARVRFPNGRYATIVATQDHVSALVLRNVARGLGLSYPELRRRLGAPVQSKGKPRPKLRAAPTTRVASKADVRRTAATIRDELRHIEADATDRDRDPSVYDRAHKTLLAALKALGTYRSADAAMRRQAQ